MTDLTDDLCEIRYGMKFWKYFASVSGAGTRCLNISSRNVLHSLSKTYGISLTVSPRLSTSFIYRYYRTERFLFYFCIPEPLATLLSAHVAKLCHPEVCLELKEPDTSAFQIVIVHQTCRLFSVAIRCIFFSSFLRKYMKRDFLVCHTPTLEKTKLNSILVVFDLNLNTPPKFFL